MYVLTSDYTLRKAIFMNDILRDSYMDEETAAQILWNYLLVNHKSRKADIILVCGSNDLRVAERAVELYNEGFAPRIVMSGGNGRGTEHWDKPESEVFSEYAQRLGVPKEAILCESESTNTGENIANTRQLLPNITSAIIVHKPFLERRTHATVQQLWPRLNVTITSPQLDLEEYMTPDITTQDVCEALTGEVQRIAIYPEKGFHTQQPIPKEVVDAYNYLVEQGYTKQLIVS